MHPFIVYVCLWVSYHLRIALLNKSQVVHGVENAPPPSLPALDIFMFSHTKSRLGHRFPPEYQKTGFAPQPVQKKASTAQDM